MNEKQKKYGLKNLGLPAIETISDLANEIRLSDNKIRYLAYRAQHLYKVYSIPKKSGGSRLIAQPSRELKAVQGWILRNILDKLSASEHSKGFEKESSILDNAMPHVGANYVLTVDLQDFFPSIKANKVYSIFYSVGYNKLISSVLTSICTYDGRLLQGAPTSPKLANLICAKLDSRLSGYSGPLGIVYTRYADDITLSGQAARKIYKARDFINVIISSEGFKVNEKKTKICGTQRQKRITGLVVNENHAGIGRKRYREIRVKLHRLFVGKSDDYNHVNGFLSFVYDVDYKSYKKLFLYINNLKEKYPSSSAGLNIFPEINKS
ncbi:retron St85 family RNA-directed DNA polymerase [Halomonas sp. C22]|uniref:retron St85 family RNA-directed DNA polymerase n=1 Tax=Halomonas sp. C22 TaxID=2580567 RepID=UPI0011A47251|nr:retron St85 family RNA-directed DNA polymerase [Halomonas sp. C22]